MLVLLLSTFLWHWMAYNVLMWNCSLTHYRGQTDRRWHLYLIYSIYRRWDLYLSWTFCLMSASMSDVMSRSRYSDNCSVACSTSFWLSWQPAFMHRRQMTITQRTSGYTGTSSLSVKSLANKSYSAMSVGLRASGNLPVSYILTGNLPVTYHQ